MLFHGKITVFSVFWGALKIVNNIAVLLSFIF